MRAAAALFLLTVAVFWPATGNDFTTFDDNAYVTENVWVLEGLSAAGLHWAFTTFHEANWHPLAWVSHLLDVSVFGLRPFGHHLTSVLLHAANAALLFLFLRGATGAAGRSALAAALFAVHPLHVESVAWVAERKDVLCAFFWMLALLAHLAAVRRPGTRRRLSLLGLFALGLLSKPMIVTLPFVLLLLDVWPLGRWVPPHFRRGTAPGTPQASVGGLVREKLPLFALAAASAVVTYLAQTRGGTVGSLEVYPLSVRVGNALVSYAVYLRQTLWPHGLAAIYPHPRALPPLWQLLGAAALLGGISLAAARGARRVPAVAVGWLWYLGTLVPVIGLVQAGAQAHADRYTYLPLVGIFVALAWGAAPLRERFCPPRAAAALAALTLVTLALVTRSQIGTWRDTRTLLEHAIAAVEDNWVAHMTLAIDLEKRGDFAGAEEHVREMARIKRDMPKGHLPAWLRTVPPADGEAGEELPGERGLDAAGRAAWRQGVGLLREGRFREAAEQFAAVLRLQPGHAGAHNNLGMALAGVGELDAAAERFREASRLGPAEPEPLVNLGNVLLLQGDRAGAIASYRRALALQPDSAPAHANLGDALLTAGRRYAALFEYREALRLAPDHVRARRKLAEARAGAGDPRVAGPGSSGDSLDYLLLP